MSGASAGKNACAALLSSLLLILLFPHWNLVWLAPVALAPLLVAAARESSTSKRFLFGWLAGVVYWSSVCYWIEFVLEVHGGLGRGLAWFSLLLFGVLKGLHLGAFALLAGRLMPRWYALPAVAALWTGLERTHGPLGFTWLQLGNAGIDMALPMRLAPYAGVYGLSFIFAMLSVAMALVVLRRPRRELAWLLALPLVWLLPPLPRPAPGAESAFAVQPNIAEDTVWTTESMERLHRRLVALSLDSSSKLILWPEIPGPLYYYGDPALREKVTNLSRLTQAHVLFGTVAQTPDGQPLNSALLINPAGEPVARYDKIRLVPFGEFVPGAFGWVNRITKEAGDFVPGNRVVMFPYGAHRLGAFICYEAAFPDLVRRFASADVFVNLSNDGYFGRSAAHEQHLALARMRATENRRWLLRDTNDGITAAIDPAGRIAQRLEPYREQAATLRFNYIREETAYSRYGDWFAWLCLLSSVFIWAYLRLSPAQP